MRTTLTRSRRHDEAGSVLIISVIVLVVLLAVSALVIDLGFAYAQRRTMQTSADSAALGGAQDLAGAGAAAAAADAITLGNQNLPRRTIDWNTCAGDAASGFTQDASNNCISFDLSSHERVRVRVPQQTFSSLFGGILGIKSLGTSTVAIAGVHAVGNGGGLEPFAMSGAFGAGDLCLDSGGNGNSVQSCTGSVTGNFGLLDFADCSVNRSLGDNIAAGADHPYAEFGVVGMSVPDDCAVRVDDPNTVSTKTGNNVGPETKALLTAFGPFADGKAARLQRVPSDCSVFSPAWEAVSAPCGSQGAIDNRPLWEFIPETTLPGIPTSCQRATFDAALAALVAAGAPPDQQRLAMHAAIQTCITDYVSSGSRAPVFTAMTGGVVDQGLPLFDLQESPRLVSVPQMVQTTAGNGKTTYQIKQFRTVFIQRTGANNSSSFFEPGPWNGTTLPDNSTADITGFAFPAAPKGCVPTATDSCGTMLPGVLGEDSPTQFIVGGNAVVELQG